MSRAPTIGPTGAASPAEPIGFTGPSHSPTGPAGPNVIALADRAQEVIEITELEPTDGRFIGKRINLDGSISPYPRVTWWRQSVARVPANIPQLFIYLREARERNICLIRGAPANLERRATRKLKAGLYGGEDRGDHGFVDTPTRMLPLDIDGERTNWRADPEGAIRTLVATLGEPWASTSFVWFFTTKHGLGIDEHKRWTGKIIDGKLYARIVFLTERALDEAEAKALTSIARVCIPALDQRTCLTTQLNYIRRPHWVEHPDRDVLDDIPTIGWTKGTSDYLAVPEHLASTAYWAKAQGYNADIAVHPNAEAAVKGIGSDGEVRPHVMSAVIHLLRANPPLDVTSFEDHSIDIIAKLRDMIEQHRGEIAENLVRHGKSKHVVDELLRHTNTSWALWCLNHPGILHAKTIKLTKEEREQDKEESREEVFARVARTIERSRKGATTNNPVTELLVAPTGSRKSTLIRAAAVQYVTEQPNKTVVILMPRHRLGEEQIEMLQQEHPDGNYSAAVWRGRHADDPKTPPNPQRPGKHLMKMCRRDVAAALVEDAMIDVDASLCKRGRGKNAVKCSFYDGCSFQGQKQVKANIWFAAHECAVHEMPEVFGDVGWVIFDENPLDAFMFGVDINDQVTHALDTLRTPLPIDPAKFGTSYSIPCYDELMRAREELYHALDQLQVPIDLHQGVAVPRKNLEAFVDTATGYFIKSKNPIVGRICGEFTEECPNLDAVRDKYFKTDPKPFIDAAISGYAIEYSDEDPELLVSLLTKMFDAKYFNDPNTFTDAIYGNITQGADVDVRNTRNLTFRGRVDPKIRPDMSNEQLETKLLEAATNDTIKKEVALWKLIESIDSTTLYGRIKVYRSKQGRIIRMVGLNKLAKGWNVQTLICDATGDAELLKAIWPQLVEAEPRGWQQLPRPQNVQIFQCVNRTLSKWAVAVEGKHQKEKDRQIEGARRLYAAVLTKALEYGGADVGVIVYKSTREWIEKHCFVPDWLKLVHWGDVTGTNALQRVRALFVIGRPLAPAEAVTQQTEALFGAHIPQRKYVERRKGGRIPTVPDAKGNNCIRVDVQEHPHPMGERLRRQITEGGILQAAGRARAGLRKAGEPLDIHLWTDVPVPELGPVEPVLWSGLGGGLDGLMLAAGGCWLRNIADAARAFPGLSSAAGLAKARGGLTTLHIGIPIYRVVSPPTFRVIYRRAAAGCKPAEAVFLREAADPRGWLEERLGPLAYFEVEEVAA